MSTADLWRTTATSTKKIRELAELRLENIPAQEGGPTRASWFAVTSARTIMQVQEARNQQWQRQSDSQEVISNPSIHRSDLRSLRAVEEFHVAARVLCQLHDAMSKYNVEIVRFCPMSFAIAARSVRAIESTMRQCAFTQNAEVTSLLIRKRDITYCTKEVKAERSAPSDAAGGRLGPWVQPIRASWPLAA